MGRAESTLHSFPSGSGETLLGSQFKQRSPLELPSRCHQARFFQWETIVYGHTRSAWGGECDTVLEKSLSAELFIFTNCIDFAQL